MYENQQAINYLYAVPAFSAGRAEAKLKKQVHEGKLLVETPFSALDEMKKYWDEERRIRAENELPG